MTSSSQTEVPPPLRFRWEKGTRYYEAHLEQDLWGGWMLTRVWGRRNSPMGRINPVSCQSHEEALRKLARVMKQREQRGYDPVG
jgi:predicted DNA-binding WGR domain protein